MVILRNKYTTFDKKSIINDLMNFSCLNFLLPFVRKPYTKVHCISIIIVFLSTSNIFAINKSVVQFITIEDDTFTLDKANDTIFIDQYKGQKLVFNLAPQSKKEISLLNYYLSGIDVDTTRWTYENITSYENLESGTYVFKVRREQAVQQSVTININRINYHYLVSSIILIIVVVLSLVILKFGFLNVLNKKVSSFHQDSIAPLLKKYLNKDDDDAFDNRRLTHKASVKYEKVTVLFADIQGFTKIVEHMNPETLIDELDRFFIHFDEVADKYKIEKIKTIGDAYMCAGGLPEKNRTNPIEVVLAAIEMQRYMQDTGNDARKNGKDFWELRIGIHTGPVISGVIGRKKLSFDIWGDSVNIASRMESSGVAGKINISGVTYQLIKDFFVCEYRGKMPIKYKGETDMYFVKGIVPHLSVNEEGVFPNEDFFTKLQWIRYNDVEEAVLTQMRNELPSSLKYHNVKHTIDVCTQVEVIGRAEGLSSKELLILKTAALFHDTGYMINPLRHEQQSVRFAKEMLPHYNYSTNEIEAINQLIMVTESTTEPSVLMEKIMKDADLDYLGRPDFIPLSEKLWEELCHYNGKISQKEWNKKQYQFLSKHVYYTETAKKLRQVNKEIQMKKIKELLN